MAGTMIRTALVRAFVGAVRVIEPKGADELIRHYEIDDDVERLPEVTLPVDVLRALSDEAATRVGDPFLGLRIACAIPRGGFGLFEFLLRSGSTVRKSFELAIRYSALVDDASEVSMTESEDEVRYDARIPGHPLCGGRQSNELVTAAIVRLFRQACRPDWRPRRVWFANSAPMDTAPLRSFFETDDLAFDVGSNGFSFDATDLDRPVISSDDPLNAVLERHAAAWLERYPPSGRLMDRVRDRIRSELQNGPSLPQIASALGLGKRTLQRRFLEEHTSFRDVVDEVRHELAKQYVEDRSLPLGEVAFLLGYADLRSFTRSFTRWTGHTPNAYRRQRR